MAFVEGKNPLSFLLFSVCYVIRIQLCLSIKVVPRLFLSLGLPLAGTTIQPRNSDFIF